jgi:hypothetical protein
MYRYNSSFNKNNNIAKCRVCKQLLFSPNSHFTIVLSAAARPKKTTGINEVGSVLLSYYFHIKAKETKKCLHRDDDDDDLGSYHVHDYYSIWFNLNAAFFKSEEKSGVIKLKTHYFISYHYHVMKCLTIYITVLVTRGRHFGARESV